jgi:hypothetical protein
MFNNFYMGLEVHTSQGGSHMIRKTLAVALAVVLGYAPTVFAVAQLPSRAPVSDNSFFLDDTLLGCAPFSVSASTNPSIVVASGSGFVERLCAFQLSGATTSASGYVIAFDSAPSTSNCIVGTNNCGLGQFGATTISGVPITPAVQSVNVNVVGATNFNNGCLVMEGAPARFNNGLVVTNSSGTITAVGCYRLDPSASDNYGNPGP